MPRTRYTLSSTKRLSSIDSQKGYTPLLTACQYQKNTLVRKLLPAGADPTIITEASYAAD